jgi:hypothetical protein
MTASLDILAGDDLEPGAVRARLNFSEKVPRAYANSKDPSQDVRPIEAREVLIRDARPIRDRLSLDVEGFVLVDHVSRVSHLREGQELEDTFHEEGCALIKALTGADIVLPYRPLFQVRTSRRGETAERPGSGRSRPAPVVHQDVSGKTFRVWMADTQEAEGTPVPHWSRCALYNIWRAVSPPPQDFPLAVTDASVTRDRECVVMENESGRGFYLETLVGVYDPNDRWYYFPDMRDHELLVFKGYDTRFGDTQTVLHTSFDDTGRHPGAAPRESIETRFFAFWL